MAELVQQTLEQMTNEVQELERVGLFDRNEIKWVSAIAHRLSFIQSTFRFSYKLVQ